MSANRTQLSLTSADGTQIVAQRWSPGSNAKAAALVIPGYADHAERYRELALAFAQLGIDTVAVDIRGHGRSSGQRGYVDHFDDYHRDIEAAFNAMTASARGVPHVVLGHSHGGLLALDWVSRTRPNVRGLVVTNPFLALAMLVSPIKIGLGLLFGRVMPRVALPSGIDPKGLTHDTTIVEAYKRDPHVFKTAAAGWFRESRTAQARVRAVRHVDVPLLYVHSDKDPIASPSANADLARAIASPDKQIIVREGELHEVLNEVNRAELINTIAEWILMR